jgi:hypothetical protein
MRQLLRCGKRLPRCHNAVGKTDAFGFFAGNTARLSG